MDSRVCTLGSTFFCLAYYFCSRVRHGMVLRRPIHFRSRISSAKSSGLVSLSCRRRGQWAVERYLSKASGLC